MGTGPSGRKKGIASKNKKYKRSNWLCRRRTDVDQVQDTIEKIEGENPGVEKPQPTIPYDDDLPGGGQFYCLETDMHFINAKALADHKKSRYFKRRLRNLKEEKYTQEEAERAAGMTKEVLPKVIHQI